jgi:hypothetical protein
MGAMGIALRPSSWSGEIGRLFADALAECSWTTKPAPTSTTRNFARQATEVFERDLTPAPV